MTRRQSPQENQVQLIWRTNSECIKNVRNGNILDKIDALANIFQGAGSETE